MKRERKEVGVKAVSSRGYPSVPSITATVGSWHAVETWRGCGRGERRVEGRERRG